MEGTLGATTRSPQAALRGVPCEPAGARASLLDTEPGQAPAPGDTHQRQRGPRMQAAGAEGAAWGHSRQPVPRVPLGVDALVQPRVSHSVMEVFPRPRERVPAPPDTLANTRSAITILPLTDRRERQREKDPGGILGCPSEDPQTPEPAQLHGLGCRHSSRPLGQGTPEGAGCFRTEKPAAARGRGALHARGEPHGLAEKISFTREGRMWQESPVVLPK